VLHERRIHTRAALMMKRVDGHIGQHVRVVRIGRCQVPLCGDVRTGQPAHPLAEPRGQPIPRDAVVPRGGDFAEQRAVRDVVQSGREHELVIGPVIERTGRRLQRVVQLVDRILIPHPAQRAQDSADFVNRSHGIEYTWNWSIPIVNLLFDAAILAGRAVVARNRKAQAPCV
jgi:hypothetical protein